MKHVESAHLKILTALLILILGLCACSEDDRLKNINGFWSGENTNDTTAKSWKIQLFFDQHGKSLTGVYSDYHGNFSMRNGFYDGDDVRFTVDIYPDSVTFFGNLEGKNVIRGTWSHSGTGNNGTFSVLRD